MFRFVFFNFAAMQASLHLDSISLVQFKNYTTSKFNFTNRITALCGPNGAGKTNILDAIYYLCLTRSYFGKTDSSSVCFGYQGFRVDGQFNHSGEMFNTSCILRETGKKEIQLNGVPYNKFSSHIGKFPVVMVAPDDVQLITGGSEDRRKFIDTIISQLDASYLQQLIIYNKLLQSRNSLLKQFAEQGKRDYSLLEVIENQMISPSEIIYATRKKFLETYIASAKEMYKMIAETDEGIQIEYISQLHSTPLYQLFQTNREKDFYSLRTSAGIHKDELEFRLGEHLWRQIASQGQRKSLLFALKLAEFNMLLSHNHFPPLLLLDDIFEKLDEKRMYNLLSWACVQNNGQVFLTDTHFSRLNDALTTLSVDFSIHSLEIN